MATIDKRTATDGSISYRVRVRKQGYPTRTKSFRRKTDAQAWARQLEGKIDRGQSIPTQEAAKRTLGNAIDRYVEHVLPFKPRNKDARNVQRHLEWWKDQLGTVLLSAITSDVIGEKRDQLRSGTNQGKGKGKKPRSNATVNRYLMALSAVLTTAAGEWNWLEKSPMAKVSKYSESRGRTRSLSDKERHELLKACRSSDSNMLYPAVVLALATGMRQGEVLGLTWDRVNLKRGTIILEETKNGERRTVPLVGHAAAVLKEYKRVHRRVGVAWVFPSKDGKKPAAIRQSWHRAVRIAELQDFRFHDLRHSAASYLAMNGATLTEIAEVLGHKTLAMVKRYSHLTEQHTASVVERMNQAVFES